MARQRIAARLLQDRLAAVADQQAVQRILPGELPDRQKIADSGFADEKAVLHKFIERAVNGGFGTMQFSGELLFASDLLAGKVFCADFFPENFLDKGHGAFSLDSGGNFPEPAVSKLPFYFYYPYLLVQLRQHHLDHILHKLSPRSLLNYFHLKLFL